MTSQTTPNKLRVPKELVLQLSQSLVGEQRDESAVPSYTHGNPLVRWIIFRRLDVIMAFVNEILPDRVPTQDTAGFDFGCGVGLLMPFLAARFETLHVTDICLDGAKAAASHYSCRNVRFHSPSEVFSAIPDRSVNVIVAADVLEHVENLEEIIMQFRRKLAPGGAIIISGPTENTLYKICRKIAGFTGDYHVRNIFDIEKLFVRCGFSLTKQKSLPFPLLPKLFRISLYVRT